MFDDYKDRAFAVGDRIAMLYRGAVRQVGTAAQIRDSHDAVVRQIAAMGGDVSAFVPAEVASSLKTKFAAG